MVFYLLKSNRHVANLKVLQNKNMSNYYFASVA